MRHADTIDNINRARSKHLQGVVPQQNCSVLINTYTIHPGLLRHCAQKSADASAFGEMLLNDGIANETQRSEERRRGKGGVGTCRSRCAPSLKKNTKKQKKNT